MRDYRARHKRIKIATRSGGGLAETTVGSSDQGSSRVTASSCERRECDIDGNVSTEEATKTKSAETSAGVAAQDKKRKQALYSRNYARSARRLASSREGVADRGSSDMAPAEMATKQNKLKRPADTLRASRATQKNRKEKESRQRGQDERLQDLADSILLKNSITDDEMALMESGQKFTTDPRLALAYHYCCGGHPVAFVFNDEHVRESESVRERLMRVLDSPPGVAEYARCQESAAAADPSLSGIFACASCCEFLVGSQCGHVCIPLSRLPETFQVSSDEYKKRYSHLSDDKVKKYAVEWASRAWDGATQDTIRNCWRHPGIVVLRPPHYSSHRQPHIITFWLVWTSGHPYVQRSFCASPSALRNFRIESLGFLSKNTSRRSNLVPVSMRTPCAPSPHWR